MWLLIVLLIVISHIAKIQCVEFDFLQKTKVWLSDIISDNDVYCYQIEHKTKSSKSGHKGIKNNKKSKTKGKRSTATLPKTAKDVRNNFKSRSLIDGEANDMQIRAKTPVLDESSTLETQRSIDLNYLDNKSISEKGCLVTVEDLDVDSTFDDDIEECKYQS